MRTRVFGSSSSSSSASTSRRMKNNNNAATGLRGLSNVQFLLLERSRKTRSATHLDDRQHHLPIISRCPANGNWRTGNYYSTAISPQAGADTSGPSILLCLPRWNHLISIIRQSSSSSSSRRRSAASSSCSTWSNTITRTRSTGTTTTGGSKGTSTTTSTNNNNNNNNHHMGLVVDNPSFKVAKVSYDGSYKFINLQASELLKKSAMYARDLVTLNLTSRQERQNGRRLLRKQQQQQQQQQHQNGSPRPTDAAFAATGNANTNIHHHAMHHRHHPVRRTTVSAISPRKNIILLSFGNIRAVASLDSILLFDAHNLIVQDFAKKLATIYQDKNNNKNSNNNNNNNNNDNDNNNNNINDRTNGDASAAAAAEHAASSAQQQQEPNELIFLEYVLSDTIDSYTRILHLYEPFVNSFLDKVNDEVYSDMGVHQLVPLKDSLQSFEMEIKQSLDCITSLLDNDDDMLSLLLTEQYHATQHNESVEFSRHEHVEILLGVYARQLNNLLMEIHYNLSRIQSKQEFVTLALSSYRNRLVRTNVHIGLAGLAIGISTSIAGFFGMNVPNGLESSSIAFIQILFGSSLMGFLVSAGTLNYLSGSNLQKRASQRLREIETLSGALSDMSALDYTIQSTIMQQQQQQQDQQPSSSSTVTPSSSSSSSLNRQQFLNMLKNVRHSKTISDDEVELLFHVLDKVQDGYLSKDDLIAHQLTSGASTRK